MSDPAQPNLSLHYGSSATAISQVDRNDNLPTTMKYPPITIKASPKTDLWRKPPNTDVDNAPTILINTPINLHIDSALQKSP
jgi:hypothetical protein